MNPLQKLIVLKALCLAPLLHGCQSSPSESKPMLAEGLRTATMSRGSSSQEATNIFSQSDPTIHTLLNFNDSAKGVKVRCVIIIVNANAQTPPIEQVVQWPQYQMDLIANRPAGGWPIGPYRTEIYMGDQLARRVPWEVR